ncbi:site-2 protease family protein [Fulvivirga sediminis]|uniref:Site-2 protease family protein n=1 Tax=Fulvivirga sediminis TaxID=2803949 RepID=A0A937K3E1_9BACT|nr:site-2 protease family protein [Fulvivirga sediminis]MBL3658872.1 site-2 protease family protein [Fulvivirga sediminis]
MKENNRTYLLQALLFIVTFFTTTLAGEWWVHGIMWPWNDYSWTDFSHGLPYSVPFLLILSVHEFGHYFTAKYHKIKTTLPYYIPLPPIPLFIGTMGALIRIKQPVLSKKIHFDIGIAGPLAGFVIALGVLVYGFTHLPEPDYIYSIHPEYEQFGENYAEHVYTYEFQREQDSIRYVEARTADSLRFVEEGTGGEWGFPKFSAPEKYENVYITKPLLFVGLEKLLVSEPEKIPNSRELMHYPILLAGFLALLFTALNLMPIGQLDGGHVLYGLVGYKGHKKVASVVFIAFLFYAGLGYISPADGMMYKEGLFGLPEFFISMPLYIGFLYLSLRGLQKSKKDTWMYAVVLFAVQFFIAYLYPDVEGYSGWLLFAFILGRVIGVHHPKSLVEEPLDWKRKLLGWISLIIFIISFSPAPIMLQ